jgi:peptide/nickel transport system permease protein
LRPPRIFLAFKQKSALIGLAVVVFFALLAVFAPFLTPYPNAYLPSAWYASTPYSLPSWVKIFPGYSNYSSTVYLPSDTIASFKSPAALDFWRISSSPAGSLSAVYNSTFGPTGEQYEKLAPSLVNTGAGSLQISGIGLGSQSENITLSTSFHYSSQPTGIYLQASVYTNLSNESNVYLEGYLVNPANKSFWILDSGTSAGPENSGAFQSFPSGSWQVVSAGTLTPTTMPFSLSLGLARALEAAKFLAQEAFSTSGTYTLRLVLEVSAPAGSHVQVYLSDLRLAVFGQTYGVLGTDINGASVWSQFVYGARTSLLIGLIASVLIITIGLFVGLMAGYAGGVVDLGLVALNDVLLVIPFLPLLITLGALVFELNLHISKVVLLITLITVLAWPGTARVIRSQTLSLKNRTYVKASKGFGGGSLHIVLHHILPELIGILFAQLALDVPAVIGIEAGLDFLGLGITSFPTWGNMIGIASGQFSAQNGFLWWWILPPGLGLTFLGVAFYVFGEAVRETWSIKRVSK